MVCCGSCLLAAQQLLELTCMCACLAVLLLQVVHGDIKPENLLVSSNGELKISDFGCSRWAQGRAQTALACNQWREVVKCGPNARLGLVAVLRLHNCAQGAHQDGVCAVLAGVAVPCRMADGSSSQAKLTGTPAFTAPELVSGNAADPFAADVWALGACLFCFIYGRVPFQGGCVLDVFKVCMPVLLPACVTTVSAVCGLLPLLCRALQACVDARRPC
jgi:serine/threonine protein kinase